MYDSFYNRYGKRIFDFCGSLFGLAILSPLFMAVAFLIKSHDGGPVFFKQKRVGQNFKPFCIYKFRTMVVDADKIGPSVTKRDDPRITSIGKILRKSKVDELPQLFNVLKGDMSLVGPRPEVPRYVEMYKEEYREILKLKPGITDLASINYRDEEELLGNVEALEEFYRNVVLPDKLRLALEYRKNISFTTDLKIIFLTLKKILK